MEAAPGLRRLTLSGNQLAPEVAALENQLGAMAEGDEEEDKEF